MIVYALYDSYCTGVDQWVNIIDLYVSEDDAIMAQILLEQTNTDIKCQSYYVVGIGVK